MGQHVRMTRSGKVLRTAGTATAGLGLLALIWAGVTTPAFAGTSGSGNDPLLCVLGICIGGGSGSSSSPSPSAPASSPTATSAPGLTQPSPSASSAPAGSGTGSGSTSGNGSTKTGSGSSTGKVSSASPSASAPAPSASQSSAGLQALADAASTTPNAGQPKTLPTTSAPTIPVGGTGLALAAGGVVLLVVSRRRRVSA